ncbi:MAG: MFS transporter [Candidatus Bathyarchaeia archaeon]
MSQLLSLIRNRNIQLFLSYFFLRNLFQLGTTLFAFYVLSILVLTPEQWGYIIFIGYISSTITSFAGGSVADRIGRKKTYLLGVPLIGLGWLSLVFFKNWVQVAVAYGTINGAIAGVYPAYTGLISQTVGKERLGGGLGLLNTAWSASSVLGAFLAGVVAEYSGFPTLYMLLCAFCFLGIIPLSRIREEKSEICSEHGWQEKTGLLNILRSKSLVCLCFAVFLVSLGGYISMFYPDYVQTNFPVTSIHMGVFDSIYAMIWTISNYPAGWLSDAIGRKKVIVIGFLLMGFAWAVFPIPQNLIWLYLLYGLYSIGNSMGYFTTALAMDIVPKEKQSTAVGIFNGTMFFAVSISGMVGGMLWTKLGVVSFLLPLLVCSVASTIISLFVK